MKEWERVLYCTIMALMGNYLCKFTVYQSLLIALFWLAFWELREIKFAIQKKNENEKRHRNSTNK